jgi:integrase
VHLTPFFGSRSMDSIKTEDVLDLVTVLEAKDLAPKTIKNIVATLSALFNFAKGPQRRWATANPCEGLELPAVPDATEIRFLTLDEIDALVAHARPGIFHAIDRAMYRTAAMTGLRQGELLALRWRDVDWMVARIRVRQNYVLGEFGAPKSKRSTRSVPMADEVAGALDRLFKPSRWQGDDDLVFAHPATGERSTRRASCAASARPSRRRSSTHRTASTICATRSEPGWRGPACRCARCRSGWATATLRRRRSTPTTRRAPGRRRWSPPRSCATEVAIQVAI